MFFFNTLVASFVILILFEPLRTVIEGQVQKLDVPREVRAQARASTRCAASWPTSSTCARRCALAIAALEESRRVTHAAIYLVDADGAGYELHGHLGPRPVERVDAAARRPFFERLARARGVGSRIEQLEREHAGRAAPSATETRDHRRHRRARSTR